MAPTILIVEDEADLALMVRYNLEAEGFRVSTAASGDEAAELMRERYSRCCSLTSPPTPSCMSCA